MDIQEEAPEVRRWGIKTRKVIELLQSDPRWWYGLELVAKSDGVLKRGTVYLTLARMEKAGTIESRKEDSIGPAHIQRRMYRIRGVNDANPIDGGTRAL